MTTQNAQEKAQFRWWRIWRHCRRLSGEKEDDLGIKMSLKGQNMILIEDKKKDIYPKK